MHSAYPRHHNPIHTLAIHTIPMHTLSMHTLTAFSIHALSASPPTHIQEPLIYCAVTGSFVHVVPMDAMQPVTKSTPRRPFHLHHLHPYHLLRQTQEPLISRAVTGSFVHVFRMDAMQPVTTSTLLGQRETRLDMEYSLIDLGLLAARGGGFLNGALSITFIVFMVVGPVMRTVTQICVLLLPLRMPQLRKLHRFSRNISSFNALEV